MNNTDARRGMTVDQLGQLVYELLDAHVDTIRLGEELSGELEWAAHLEYLRGLQRVGREVLAGVAPISTS